MGLKRVVSVKDTAVVSNEGSCLGCWSTIQSYKDSLT